MGSTLRFSAALAVLFCGSFFFDSNAQTQIQPGQVLISELRLAGEAGAQDEYVEIYNNTNSEQSSNYKQKGARSFGYAPLFLLKD